MKPDKTDSLPPEIGASLQKHRLAHGLTLENLSRLAGVSKSMLSQIEHCKTNPTISVTWRLANALGISINQLLLMPEEDETLIHAMWWKITRRPLCLGIRLAMCSKS